MISQSIFTPAALRIFLAAPVTSGPMPSPWIRVMRCAAGRLAVALFFSVVRRGFEEPLAAPAFTAPAGDFLTVAFVPALPRGTLPGFPAVLVPLLPALFDPAALPALVFFAALAEFDISGILPILEITVPIPGVRAQTGPSAASPFETA